MRRPSILFLCTGNSCRSQMAEGWLRQLGGDRYDARSAGVEAHGLNPRAVAAMAEAGVDIRGQRSELIGLHLLDPPDIVVTVCDHAAACCPDLPKATRVLHRQFDDPAKARGEEPEVRASFQRVRDEIRAAIAAWIADGTFDLTRSGAC